jgi:polar amino acid transport system substrate-binding protein
MFALGIGGTASAQPDPEPEPPLRVAVTPIEPWVLRDGDRADGFYIEIWKAVAESLGRESEFVWVDSFGELLPSLESGSADVAVAPLAATAERERMYDFSSAVVRSGPMLGVHERLIEQRSLLGALFSKQVLFVLLGALAWLLFLAHLIWLVERNDATDAGMFRKPYPKGVWDGFWWASVTLATVGYGDKAPRSFKGRLVGILAIISSLFTVGAFVSQVTSTLSSRGAESRVQTLNDARSHRIGAVEGSSFKRFVESQGLQVIGYDNQAAVFEAAQQGAIDVVVSNPFALSEVGPRFDVQGVGQTLYEEFETFGLAQGSPLREPINEAVAELQASGRVQAIVDRWVGRRR